MAKHGHVEDRPKGEGMRWTERLLLAPQVALVEEVALVVLEVEVGGLVAREVMREVVGGV